ncbi:hypothetical protein DNTS_029053 [Danionella cerebrum]|uniref:Fibrinogen-like protein 1 n=1 Tax=Danionella cerebrum TaxID=2873325 RepID=A0A553N5M0_9TELE|nr:hypothetical protein DNTS_029053 [Danionella translucida]
MPFLLIVWLFFALGSSDSAHGECHEDMKHLRMELKSLQLRHTKQQDLIQRLMNLKQIEDHSLKQDSSSDVGDHLHMDCAEIFKNSSMKSGFYLVQPLGSSTEVRVYCDMTEGGGWTVFQRRSDGSQSFDRDWNDYKKGFGDLNSRDGEFWLGNDNLHFFTSQVYRNFKVANEEVMHYQLQFGEYTGNAGDALSGSYHPEVQWWASHQGMKCHSTNLNGFYHRGPYSAETDDGIVWYPWHGWWYSLKAVQMKIRPAGFEPNVV